jgi:hypothetical protein
MTRRLADGREFCIVKFATESGRCTSASSVPSRKFGEYLPSACA